MNKTLYVGGLSYDSTEESVQKAFAEAGTVESVKIITDRETGKSRGFGFVDMSTEEDAQKAIDMFNGKELDGRTIIVNEARPQRPRSEGGDSFGRQQRW